MSESKIETAKGMCVVDVTKFLMKRNNCTGDVAYAHFMGMELYQLLMDTDSGMCYQNGGGEDFEKALDEIGTKYGL
jgi:hypothetical protein